MNEETDLLQIIRAAMKTPNRPTGTKNQSVPVVPLKTKGARLQPRRDEHGKLGDFSRSNSNPPTRTNNTAIIGYEEVPKTRFSQKHSDSDSLAAETEMVRKAIKLVLTQTGGAPSKAAVKRSAAPKMTRSDRVFKTTGPGSSRSVVIDRIKAISATETGCIVRDKGISLSASQRNANTTQGNYNPMIVE